MSVCWCCFGCFGFFFSCYFCCNRLFIYFFFPFSFSSFRMLEAWGYVFTQNDEDDFFLITKSPFTNPKSEPTPTPTTPESTKAYKIEISCPLVIEKKTEGEGAGGMQEAAMGEGEGQEGEEGEGGMKVTEDMLKNFEQIEGGFIGGEGVEGGAQNQPTEEEMEKFWQQSQEQVHFTLHYPSFFLLLLLFSLFPFF